MKKNKLLLISLFSLLSAMPLIAAPGDPASPIRQKFDALILDMHKKATGEKDYFLNLNDGSAFEGKDFLWKRFTESFQTKANAILDELDINYDPQSPEIKELEKLVQDQVKEWHALKNKGKPSFSIVPTDVVAKTPEQAWAELMRNYRHHAIGKEDQLLNFGNGQAYSKAEFREKFAERNIFTYFQKLKDKYPNVDEKERLTNVYLDTQLLLQNVTDSPKDRKTESKAPYATSRPFGYEMHVKLHKIERYQFTYLDSPYGPFSEIRFLPNNIDEAVIFDLPVQVRNRSVPIGFKISDVIAQIYVSVEEMSDDGKMPVKRIPLVRETLDGYRSNDGLTIGKAQELKFAYYAEADKNYRLVFSNPAGKDDRAGVRLSEFTLGK